MALEFVSVGYPFAGDGDFSILRETFNNNLEILTWDLSKFRIIPLSGGVEPKIEEVVMPPGMGDALDLVITTMTGESGLNSYKAWIESGYLREIRAGTLDTPNNEFLFVGDCAPFVIDGIVSLDSNTVEIKFNRKVKIDSDLLNPSQYTFTNGLFCVGVEVAGEDSIRLLTTAQDPAINYELTI